MASQSNNEKKLTPIDLTRMHQALSLAHHTLLTGETPISCIITDSDNNIIAHGSNMTNSLARGTAHAEFMALESLRGYVKNLKGCTVYVTIEPCVMCCSLLNQLQVSRVVYGAQNERFGGCGTVMDIPDDSMEIIKGCYYREAILLLRMFYAKENKSAPTPNNKSNRILDKENFPNQPQDLEDCNTGPLNLNLFEKDGHELVRNLDSIIRNNKKMFPKV